MGEQMSRFGSAGQSNPMEESSQADIGSEEFSEPQQ
jgi:hypothetical protein